MLESMKGPINAIGQDPLGIGYFINYYAVFIFPNEDVKLLGVEGVVPCSYSETDCLVLMGNSYLSYISTS